MMSKVVKTTVEMNGMTYTVREAGMENEGELVIFLHGFPECSLIWEKTMAKLSDLGYRCFAPDQRGYSEGARPDGYQNYAVNILAEDVIGFAELLGEHGKFHLVGHDFGAVVGWTVVAMHQERIISWTALSVPYWSAYYWAIQNDPEQQKKGAYVKHFQEPKVPEQMLAANDYAILKRLWEGFDEKVIQEYMQIFDKADALTAVVNWYRALFMVDTGVQYQNVTIPVMFIWGNQDLAIGRAGVEKSHTYMKGDYQFCELDAGHWLTEFNESEVSKLIITEIIGHR